MANVKDLVGEKALVTGLGNIRLTGALPEGRSFGDAYEDGATLIPVKIEELNAQGGVIWFEYSLCTYDASVNELTRDTVRLSSNDNNFVTFGTRPKRVFVFTPGEDSTSLVADVNTTRIVGNQIRVKLDVGAANNDNYADVRLIGNTESGLHVNLNDINDALPRSTVAHVSREHVDILNPTFVIDGVTINYASTTATGRFSSAGDLIILANQNDSSENGLYQCRNAGGLFKLVGRSIFYVKSNSEIWSVDGDLVKRISSPSYKEILTATFLQGNYTITHGKNTNRPQVRLFDMVTNEELFAQPSNITLNSFDLALYAFPNDIEIVVNITPDT